VALVAERQDTSETGLEDTMRQHKVIGGRWVVRTPFKRHGLWRYRVRDNWTGRVHEVATREADQRRAEQAVIDWIEEMGRREEIQAVAFDAAFEEWLGLKDIRPSTMQGYRYAFEAILRPAFGTCAVHEIEPKHIEEFLHGLRTKRGNAKKTQRERLVLLRSFFAWSVRRYAWADPTADIHVRRVPKYEGRALTPTEARALIKACRTPIVHRLSDKRRPAGWD
jgi:integrase-like protein